MSTSAKNVGPVGTPMCPTRLGRESAPSALLERFHRSWVESPIASSAPWGNFHLLIAITVVTAKLGITSSTRPHASNAHSGVMLQLL